MNTYYKFAPNVFLAKCTEPHAKGETIPVTTKHGKENECIVFNQIGHKDGFYYYSIVRADGFNTQEWAKKKAEKYENASGKSDAQSEKYWEAAQEGRDFLAMGEPIKVGHHSEKRHRALFERNDSRMRKSVEAADKAQEQADKAAYWASRANDINLSMPESIEYYEFELQAAIMEQEGLKNGTIPREHSFSLTYATKKVKDLEGKFKMAKKLWVDDRN